MVQMKRGIVILFVLSLTLVGRYTICCGEIVNEQSDIRAKLSNAALKDRFDVGAPDISQIKSLLSKQDITALETLYDTVLRQYINDTRYEQLLHEAYFVFSPSNGISIADLDYWVSTTGSYMAFAARGVYNKELGYVARGTKLISKTPDYRIADMKELHREAAKDLQIAINKNPFLMPAYFHLISIAKASVMPFTPREILNQALRSDKRTQTVRLGYMLALQPRWGGSYEEMAKFGKESAEYAAVNPLLWALQGEVFAEQASSYVSENNNTKAIEAYNMALKYGDRTVWLKKRAACLWDIGQLEKAVEDYKKALYYNPNDTETKTMLQSLQIQMRKDNAVTP